MGTDGVKPSSCPHCDGLISPGIAKCPHCAGELFLDPQLREALCPRCGSLLEHFTINEQVLDTCPDCTGLWVDRGEFSTLTRESEVYRTEPVPEKRVPLGPIRDPGGCIPCVRCGKLMNRMNFAKISGVIVDVCERHGVWLDHRELEKIRLFIVDGGLERSQDREIMRNRDDLRALASTTQNTRFAQRAMHFFNWKRWFFTGW